MIVSDALKTLTEQLKICSQTPRLEAELLLCLCLKKERVFLYAHAEYVLSEEEQFILQAYKKRRLQGEPLAYLSGQQEFFSLSFKVTQDTLIPRPETEHLVEWLLDRLPNTPLLIADLGTGSGAIAIALAKYRPNWTIHATDQSEKTLNIARQNAKKHEAHNVHFYLGHWCEALPLQNYAVIVSNPPYLAEEDPHLSALQFEPRQALVSGKTGLEDLETIIHSAKNKLDAEGRLVLEHGEQQAKVVEKLLQSSGYTHIHTHLDLAGKDRFTEAMVNHRT